jgi:hypothetical protein
VLKNSYSKAQLDRCYQAAKKVLRHFDLEPELVDMLTKKQRQHLFIPFELPGLKVEKGHSVPRQYVEKIKEELFEFMKTQHFGKPENQLSYMELAVYGMGFYTLLRYYAERDFFKGSPIEEEAKRIGKIFEVADLFQHGFGGVREHLRFLTRSYSQVNFRLYGFTYKWDLVPLKVRDTQYPMKMKITLTAQDCEARMFVHKEVPRKAFRLILTANGLYDPTWAIVKRKLIFPSAKEDETLNIYIQSHVLHRFKQRMDIFNPSLRNFLIQYALTTGQEVVMNANRKAFLACLSELDLPVGYFTFFIQDDNLVVNTFLPLAGAITPEGQKLHAMLPLSKEDMVYLGMDKVSFYTEIDFDQIPLLKQALMASGIWPSKLMLDGMLDRDAQEEGESPIDEQKTKYVKEFFEKYEQHYRAQAGHELSLATVDVAPPRGVSRYAKMLESTAKLKEAVTGMGETMVGLGSGVDEILEDLERKSALLKKIVDATNADYATLKNRASAMAGPDEAQATAATISNELEKLEQKPNSMPVEELAEPVAETPLSTASSPRPSLFCRLSLWLKGRQSARGVCTGFRSRQAAR